MSPCALYVLSSHTSLEDLRHVRRIVCILAGVSWIHTVMLLIYLPDISDPNSSPHPRQNCTLTNPIQASHLNGAFASPHVHSYPIFQSGKTICGCGRGTCRL